MATGIGPTFQFGENTAFAIPATATHSHTRRLANIDRRTRPRSPDANKIDFENALQRLYAGSPWVEAEGNQSLFYRAVKRTVDIIGALIALTLFSPVMLTVFLLLLVTTRGKPLFVQNRVGYRGRTFKMLKFRSMRLDAHKMQDLIKNEKEGPIFKNRRDPRITRIGRWIRATSIDETPQLFNVLMGHMSLVGPRPMVIPEVARQACWQHRRLGVKPGLTCLWQVSGRSDVGFEDWMRMDLWYLSNQNLQTDLKLLVKTPLTVISCKGAY